MKMGRGQGASARSQRCEEAVMVDERRKFERVVMPQNANVYVATSDEKKLGGVRMLGRGGFQIETTRQFKVQDVYPLVLVDSSEGIKRKVRGIVRNIAPGGLIGFEFENLDADAAVEVGVIIGKYYSASGAGA